MAYETQPDFWPTNKGAIAAAASIVTYHLVSNFLVPPELVGAYTILIEFGISFLVGIAAMWPVKDRAGVAPKENNAGAPEQE